MIPVQAEALSRLLLKMDALTDRVDALAVAVDAQHQSTQALEELVHELTPVANQAFKTAVRTLDEIDGGFSSEDLVHLGKQALANTRHFSALLTQLESVLDLLADVRLLSKPVFDSAVRTFDQLERQGYIAFGREGLRIADRVVTEFSEDDVRALGDNIVTILRTVKNMTQPDIMALANRAADSLHEPEPAGGDVSVWKLMRDLNDPKVRQGLARLMRVLRTLAEQPGGRSSSN
jgi:uncharacterized protein YjgD (DUF1641 family)